MQTQNGRHVELGYKSMNGNDFPRDFIFRLMRMTSSNLGLVHCSPFVRFIFLSNLFKMSAELERNF
jgi:hypothetical protein